MWYMYFVYLLADEYEVDDRFKIQTGLLIAERIYLACYSCSPRERKK